LTDAHYDEESEIDYFRKMGDSTVMICYYLYKLILFYLLGNYGRAEEIAVKGARIVGAMSGAYLTAIFNFYHSLALAANYHAHAGEKKKEIIRAIRINQKQMKTWAEHCRENFQHKYCLVEAELARIGQERHDAMDLYDKAVALAKKNEFLQEEALANERAAVYWLQKGKEPFARLYVTEAHKKYHQWGATAKTAALEKSHPFLGNICTAETPGDGTPPAESLLDRASVIKAIQTISNEIVTENLLAKLIQIISENAGAQKGSIVLDTENELTVAAGFNVDEDEKHLPRVEKLENAASLSEAVVRYVIRTGETLLLSDASGEGPFMNDGYIKTNGSRSVLAMPVRHKKNIQGALYLENNLAANIFTGQRVKLLELILSQAAISLENAKLFDERVRAEAELRRLRNYLTNIIDSMPSVLVGVDAAGVVTQWNKTAEKETGVVAESARGRILSDVFPRMAPDMEAIAESIRSREIKQIRKRSHQAESGVRYENVTIYPLTANGVEDAGVAGGAVIRVDDVTRQVRIEEMMIQGEKMLSVGGLAAGMAHEINNPLAGMMQTASVMASRLGGEMDIPANRRAAEAVGVSLEAIRGFMEARGVPGMIDTINESGRRVARIVSNMLSFARKSDDLKTSNHLAELLDKTLDLARTDYNLKSRCDFKMIEIRKEYEAGLPPAFCESAKIQQVVLNILRNGAHAMQSAGVRTPRFILRARSENERRMVRVEIEDNGPGMDEATRKRVFEPFYTTKPEGEGTGLGLSVSYFIITENHGGEMAVQSQPGAGAKFIIRLPLERGYS
ncbi:MAG: GAF domain-containing protein, partial [Desulfobacterales bacterium]|nr:GAF domain-containing protein [Desulfobacterales bacterium]